MKKCPYSVSHVNLLVLCISTVANHLWRTFPENVPLGETLLRANRSSCVTTIQSKTDRSLRARKKCATVSRQGSKRNARILSFCTHARTPVFARPPSKQAMISRLRAPTRRRKIVPFDLFTLVTPVSHTTVGGGQALRTTLSVGEEVKQVHSIT